MIIQFTHYSYLTKVRVSQRHSVFLFILLLLNSSFALCQNTVNLLDLYPTTLTEGDTNPANARPWSFTENDVYTLSEFNYIFEDQLKIETSEAIAGIGHTSDGAVWAVIIPLFEGTLTSSIPPLKERIQHIWLRFHPNQINALIPSETVTKNAGILQWLEIKRIADSKFSNSFHAGPNAMIPPPELLIVDIDTSDPVRRFFVTDQTSNSLVYHDVFEELSIPEPTPLSEKTTLDIFDRVWEEFDKTYPMFILRPAVHWDQLKAQFRSQAAVAKTQYELVSVLAELLAPLRDLHVWLQADGTFVPVYNPPVDANANASAYPLIIRNLTNAGSTIQWGITQDQIGFLAIHSWTDENIVNEIDQIFEQLKETKSVIVDVRYNAGGNELLARQVAGRFADQEYTYAFHQYRNGPEHTNFTEKIARTFEPNGAWQYEKPVIVLIGPKCMSSNESFIQMMDQCPQVTLMGETTRGSSGNPKTFQLPFNISVGIPQWIDYLPNGEPLDERGINPDIFFQPQVGAFEGNRDDLLKAALQQLSQSSIVNFTIFE